MLKVGASEYGYFRKQKINVLKRDIYIHIMDWVAHLV
jgi:hypothetical protein